MSRIFLLSLLVTLAITGCGSREEPADPIRPVQLTQVNIGGVAPSAVFAGEIKPRYETDLGFRISGKIVERKVDIGAKVQRGEVLARLDSADVDLQARAAQTELDAAEADFAFATAEYERYQELFNQKMIGASTLDTKRTVRDIAKLKAGHAQALLAVTQNQVGYALLLAPEDGVITAMFAEAGQVVTQGQAVMRLARQIEPEVSINVPESRLDELRSAPTLLVELLARPGKHYPARVREIAPVAEPTTRTFNVRISVLEADAEIEWGMTARVAVLGNGASHAVLLPLSSVYHATDGAPAVWIYDQESHAVSLRKVTLGAYREDGVLIEDGLRQGEWVVSAGVHKLQPGQVVRPYESADPAASPQ
jgi:multidrug efflux system membrane fusion protein